MTSAEIYRLEFQLLNICTRYNSLFPNYELILWIISKSYFVVTQYGAQKGTKQFRVQEKVISKMVKKFRRGIWKKIGFPPNVLWHGRRLNIFWQELSIFDNVCSVSASNLSLHFYNKIWKRGSGDCCFPACFKFAYTLSYIFMISYAQCMSAFVVLYIPK